MVVVSGGMNQQRHQIVDAVVIGRILGAALVVPILHVNVIWGDERFVQLPKSFDLFSTDTYGLLLMTSFLVSQFIKLCTFQFSLANTHVV